MDREKLFSSLWILLLGLLAFQAAVPSARAADPFDPSSSDNSTTEEEELDAASLKGSEDRFKWLDPSKNIYVLQNRKFRKKSRLQFSAAFGVGLSHPYRDSYSIDPRITFYLSEAWGIEVLYNYTFTSENSNSRALAISSPNALPKIREYRWSVGGMLQWNPWYAKINVFNSILHFDWYFSLGGGYLQTELDTRTQTSQASTFTPEGIAAIFWGTGHRYYVSDNIAVRLDLTGTLYRAPIAGNQGEIVWFANYTVALGLGFLL